MTTEQVAYTEEIRDHALTSALAKAHAAIPKLSFDSKNPYFNSKYVSLAGIRENYREVLAEHGLYVEHSVGSFRFEVHELDHQDDMGQVVRMASRIGVVEVTTSVVHGPSGQRTSMTGQWPVVKLDPQGVGSTVSYAKRYQVSALLDIVADADDDGNEASKPSTPPKARRAKPVPKPEPKPEPEDIESVKAYQTTIEGLRHEAEQAGTLDALASIFKRGQELIKSGIKEGMCTVEDLERWVTLKEERKEKLSNPHNLNVEDDVP